MPTHDPTIIATLAKALQLVEQFGIDPKQLAADVYDSLASDGYKIVSDPGPG
jgi:hypothetical protein